MTDTAEKDNLKDNNHQQYWKIVRALLSQSIELEVDLETRKILIDQSVAAPLQIDSCSLDSFISNYIQPSEVNGIKEALTQAGKGVEKPIRFNFIHPEFTKSLELKYKYEITYVSYSKTRLKGRLLNNKGDAD
ncbi:MAG: hypothetical protein IT236_15070 [Bacteroidia bacterium]|nr:hypothetical protein [Bacteroidia bacterium]